MSHGDASLPALLRNFGWRRGSPPNRRSDLTAHGFRSSFRDRAAEQTNYPREVAEMARSHSISDKVEAAYRRGDLLEKRRRLMEAWASYATAKPTAGQTITPMRRRKTD